LGLSRRAATILVMRADVELGRRLVEKLFRGACDHSRNSYELNARHSKEFIIVASSFFRHEQVTLNAVHRCEDMKIFTATSSVSQFIFPRAESEEREEYIRTYETYSSLLLFPIAINDTFNTSAGAGRRNIIVFCSRIERNLVHPRRADL